MGEGMRKIVRSVLTGACLAFLIAGCSQGGSGTSGSGQTASGPTASQPTQTPGGTIQGDTTTTGPSTVTNPTPNTFVPVGNIQGVVRDAVTGFAIVGAQVSLSIPGASGVSTVTTGASGQYSFTNVPASVWSDGAVGGEPDGVVQFGELNAYTLTVDFRGANALLPANADPYPGQAFADAVVGFASFQDGNNALLCAADTGESCSVTEGGSGASTPIHGLTTNLNFIVGRLTETIQGRVLDAQNGRPISGATVALLDGSITAATPFTTPARPPGRTPAVFTGIRLSLQQAPVSTDSNGFFTFRRVPALHLYNVEASVAGYVSSGTLTAGRALDGEPTGPFPSRADGLVTLVPPTKAFIDVTQPLLGTPGTGELLLAPAVPGVDSTPPYVASANPADGADIDVTSAGNPRRSLIFCFSEAMQTDASFSRATVATVDFKGLPIPADNTNPVDTAGVTGPNALVPVTQIWSQGGAACPTGGSVLTITPVNAWQAGVTYGVFLGGTPAPLSGAAAVADLAGNTCCRDFSLNVLGMTGPDDNGTGSVFGERVATPTTLLFTTNGGPTVLDGPAAALAANSADFSASTATITWPAVTGARAYEVYMSVQGGDFQLIARTVPGTSPVTQLLSRSWSFNDALSSPACITGTVPPLVCAAGVNPSNPQPSVANPNPRVSPGFDLVRRSILEATIPDVGDDTTTLPPFPPFELSAAVRLDTPDALADLSDGFGIGATSQVRIAIATLNSNGVVGSLGTPVTVRDTTGPQTNSTGNAVLGNSIRNFPATGCVAGAPILPPVPGALAPLCARFLQGQALFDRLDPDDIDGDGEILDPNTDGVPDTIVIGFSEPLRGATASCNTTATPAVPCAQYVLRDETGNTPTRLSGITVVSATYDEDTNANGVLDAGDDLNGNGVLDRGSDVNFAPGGTNIKGNWFGNTFVTLRIAPATAGGVIDIRTGDYVQITGVEDLAGNTNRPVDPTLAQNQLQDSTPPSVLRVAAADIVNNVPGVPDTITITFSEPMGGFGVQSLKIRGENCTATVSLDPTLVPSQAGGIFRSGARSVRLLVDAATNARCDLSRLAGDGANLSLSDSILFTTTTVDQGGIILDGRANALLYNTATSSFVPAGAGRVATDVVRPVLVSSTFTNNPTAGLPDTLTVTFNEPLSAFPSTNAELQANVTFRIRGVDCRAALKIDSTARFIPGATTVQLLVDPTVNAACDLSQLTGNGTTLGFSDQLTFAAGVRDIAGNLLNPLFNTLLFNGTDGVGTFTVTGTAILNPEDQFGPLVTAATFVNNPTTGLVDTVTVTFSEDMGQVSLQSATIRGVDCRAAFDSDPNTAGVQENPNSPFRTGDRSIQYLVDPAINPLCDLSRLAGDGATFLASDTIIFATATTSDVSGLTLNGDFDTLLFNGTAGTGTFMVTGSGIGIPRDRTRPRLVQVVSADIIDNTAGTPDVLVVRFNEPMRQVTLGQVRIGGVNCAAAGAAVIDPNSPFRTGDTAVRILVDTNASPTCDLATTQLVGDGTTFGASDTVTFGMTRDVAGNDLNPFFDTLLFRSASRTFEVAGSASGLPIDLTPPRVQTVAAADITKRHNARGVQTTPPSPERPDEILVTFNEPLSSFDINGVALRIAGQDCPVAADPNNLFQPGDTTVRLLIDVSPANAACSLERLAGNGTAADTDGPDDSINLENTNARDLNGNLLNAQFDVLLYDTGSKTFQPAGTALGIPSDNLRPILESVITVAVNTAPDPDLPPFIRLTFNERLSVSVSDSSFISTMIISGGANCQAFFVVDQVLSGDLNDEVFLPGDKTITLKYTGVLGAGCDPTPALLQNNDQIVLDSSTISDVAGNPLSELANNAVYDLPNTTWRVQP